MNFWNKFGLKLVLEGVVAGINNTESTSALLTSEDQQALDMVINEFPTSEKTGALGRTNIYVHKIDTGNATPFKMRFYPMSKFVLDDMNKEIDRMLALDVIEEALACPWNSPTVAVKKKDGAMRLCLDARKLNTIIVQEAYPIPQISMIMNHLSGSRFLTSIDLEAAFWQIPLEEASRPKTAFTIPHRGHFQFKVVPFGLSTASQALARVMNRIFMDLEPQVFAYLDDLIIATNSFKQHLELLKEVAARLAKTGLTINVKKSIFCRKRLKYLGYILDEEGWRVDEEKTETISKFPSPTSKKEIQRFLGMAGWFRRFIKDFAKIAAPLTDLTKAKTRFKWDEAAEVAFQTLKQALCSAPVLATPDYTKPFAIACDASDVAIGAVLTQEVDGQERAICYMSQKLSNSEKKYSTTYKECLAVVRAVEKFRGYVEGTQFDVFCDHSSLTYLKTMKNPPGLLARWILRLNAFRCVIKYRKGTSNVVPDCLSRIGEVNAIVSGTGTADPWYGKLKESVTENPDNFPDFKILHGQLYKNCSVQDEVGARVHRWKRVVPADQRSEIVRRFHDIPTAAHLGADRTLQKIQADFYWPKMAQEVKKYVQGCAVCKASKATNIPLTPAMGNAKPAKLPWEMLSIDWVGPLVRSRAGNTVLLVITDWVTKYVIAEPFRSASAAQMVDFLERRVFLRFSVPRIVLTDNGSQFLSQTFQALLTRYSIVHMKTAFYSPMCNNTERTNRTIVTCIRSLIEDDHRCWDENLQQIVSAINSAKHETLGCTPHFANFGRELIVFTDQYKQQELNLSDNVNQEHDKRMHKLENIRKFILTRIRQAHDRSKQRYDLRTRPRTFAVGDLVWRRCFNLSSAIDEKTKKLGPKFVPCFVKELRGQNMYVLEDVRTSTVGVYHAKDIKAD